MRAIIYTRVSTARQDGDDRTSLDEQLADCERYAAERGYDVIGVHREVGSGADRSRPLYRRMLAAAAAGEVDVLIAWRSDRLYRSLGAAGDLIDACDQGGARVEGANQHIDMGTLGLLAAVASMERTAIRERTASGKRGSAKAGRIPTRVPYGYRKDADGRAIIHEYEAAIVRRIFEIATVEDKGTRQIEAVLQSEAVVSPSGGRWWSTAVARILSNETYAGTLWYGRKSHETVQGRSRRIRDVPEDDWIAIDVPAIVSRETWDKARQAAARRKRSGSAGTRRGSTFLLRGLLSCHCGRRMVGTTTNSGEGRKRRTYYVCGEHMYRPAVLKDWPTGCREKPYVNAPRLDATVWGELSAWLRNPWTLADLADVADGPDLEQELEAAEKSLSRVQGEEDRVVRLYVDGSINEAMMTRQRRFIDERRDAAAALVDHLKAQRQQAARSAHVVETMESLVERVGGTLDEMDAEQRTALVRQVVEDVTLDRDGVATIRVAVRLPQKVAEPLRVSRDTWRT